MTDSLVASLCSLLVYLVTITGPNSEEKLRCIGTPVLPLFPRSARCSSPAKQQCRSVLSHNLCPFRLPARAPLEPPPVVMALSTSVTEPAISFWLSAWWTYYPAAYHQSTSSGIRTCRAFRSASSARCLRSSGSRCGNPTPATRAAACLSRGAWTAWYGVAMPSPCWNVFGRVNPTTSKQQHLLLPLKAAKQPNVFCLGRAVCQASRCSRRLSSAAQWGLCNVQRTNVRNPRERHRFAMLQEPSRLL